MGQGLAIGMVIALALGVGLRSRSDGPLWPSIFHGVIAVIGLGTVWAAGTGALAGVSVLTAALIAASPLLALPIPTVRGRLHLGATGVAMGPAIAAAALAGLGHANAVAAGQGTGLALTLGAGALLLVAVGFGLRALCRLDTAPSPGVVALLPMLIGLGWIAIASPGGHLSVLSMPLAGADGAPALWMTDVNLGLVATAPQVELGGLWLAAGLVAIIATLLPQPRFAALASAGAGLLAVLGVGYAINAHGATFEPDADAIRTLLAPLAADPSLVEQPRLMTAGPYTIDAAAATLPLALLLTAGLGGIGWGIDAWRLSGRPESTATVDELAGLGARDAFQVATIAVWLGLVIFLVLQHARFGVWGPHTPAEHLLSSAAFAMAASLAALYGMAGRSGRWWAFARSVVIVLGVGAVVGSVAGGLAGQLGVFGL